MSDHGASKGVRLYRSSDAPEVAAWYAAHGQSPKPKGSLPNTGFIVPGVAAGWLYLTDSSVALLEGYVTNPAASAADRNDALDVITGLLLASAKSDGRSLVLALTTDQTIAERARRHGMHARGTYRVLYMEV